MLLPPFLAQMLDMGILLLQAVICKCSMGAAVTGCLILESMSQLENRLPLSSAFMMPALQACLPEEPPASHGRWWRGWESSQGNGEEQGGGHTQQSLFCQCP